MGKEATIITVLLLIVVILGALPFLLCYFLILKKFIPSNKKRAFIALVIGVAFITILFLINPYILNIC